MDTILDNEAIMGAIVAVIAAAWGWLKRNKKIRQYKADMAMNFVQAAVTETYNTYVHERKAAWEDGKLTDEERATARQMAIDTAIDYAKDNGLDLVKYYGKEMLPSVIERVIGHNKIAAVPLAITPAEF